MSVHARGAAAPQQRRLSAPVEYEFDPLEMKARQRCKIEQRAGTLSPGWQAAVLGLSRSAIWSILPAPLYW